MSSLGIEIFLITSALLFRINLWMPESFLEFEPPLLISAALSATAFVVLVFFLFERRHERTPGAALYTLLNGRMTTSAPAVTDIPPDTADNLGLLPEDRQVAMLLIEGFTKGDIARKLHISSSDVGGAHGLSPAPFPKKQTERRDIRLSVCLFCKKPL